MFWEADIFYPSSAVNVSRVKLDKISCLKNNAPNYSWRRAGCTQYIQSFQFYFFVIIMSEWIKKHLLIVEKFSYKITTIDFFNL